jgi:hypothetical protein
MAGSFARLSEEQHFLQQTTPSCEKQEGGVLGYVEINSGN